MIGTISLFERIADISIMESVKVYIPLETIQIHYAKICSVLKDNQISPEFTFNIDECRLFY